MIYFLCIQNTLYNNVTGYECFVAHTGKSTNYHTTLTVPEAFPAFVKLQALFCMAKCEETDTCVGFDLRKDNNLGVVCAIVDISSFPINTYDTYIKRC